MGIKFYFKYNIVMLNILEYIYDFYHAISLVLDRSTNTFNGLYTHMCIGAKDILTNPVHNINLSRRLIVFTFYCVETS